MHGWQRKRQDGRIGLTRFDVLQSPARWRPGARNGSFLNAECIVNLFFFFAILFSEKGKGKVEN